MPSALTFPGVYVEEIPSGVRPITGVATSIAAFVGRTERGPIKKPVTVTSLAEYERIFGSLNTLYPIGFSVRGFYENGGTTAIIVRVFKFKKDSVTAKITHEKDANKLELTAKSPGAWAKNLRIRIERESTEDQKKLAELAKQLGFPEGDTSKLFNLRVRDTLAKTEVKFVNLTADSTARQIKGILAADPNSPLEVTKLEGAVTEHPTPTTPEEKKEDIWAANSKFSTGVSDPAHIEDSAALGDGDFGDAAKGTGMFALDHADLFNLLVIPPDTMDGEVPLALHAQAAQYCLTRRAMYIVDPPTTWASVATVNLAEVNISGPPARYAAVYFPRVKISNPLHGGLLETVTASGVIAGVMARTDVTRGVWKAPAGVDAALLGVQGIDLNPPMSDEQNGLLNPLGVNCLRNFPIIGNIVWGARTLRGADLLGDEYKYVPVRRTANFIEESLFRGLKWVVFEPNDEPLWAQIRLNVGAFMQGLFRQGAFQGSSPRDAYFVACDKTTTTQNDINLGIVNVVVGFAPLKPAEFVVLKIQQIAGQIQT